jgi:hypothetical protein
VRKLACIIAIGDELHFGRATRKLKVSASAITKQVQDVEADLGYGCCRLSVNTGCVQAACPLEFVILART